MAGADPRPRPATSALVACRAIIASHRALTGPAGASPVARAHAGAAALTAAASAARAGAAAAARSRTARAALSRTAAARFAAGTERPSPRCAATRFGRLLVATADDGNQACDQARSKKPPKPRLTHGPTPV